MAGIVLLLKNLACWPEILGYVFVLFLLVEINAVFLFDNFQLKINNWQEWLTKKKEVIFMPTWALIWLILLTGLLFFHIYMDIREINALKKEIEGMKSKQIH